MPSKFLLKEDNYKYAMCMTDFFMLYCKRLIKLINIIFIFTVSINIIVPVYAYSNSDYNSNKNNNTINSFQLEKSSNGLYANINTNIYINQQLIQAINKGLPVTFILEAKVYKPKWYWFDENISTSEYKWII